MSAIPNGVRHAAASAASGALGVTALAPLELIRVNMLVKRESLKTAMRSLSTGWYRGNTADVLAASARIGITMPTFALYKRLMRHALAALNLHDGEGRLPEWAVFASGALAGCTAAVRWLHSDGTKVDVPSHHHCRCTSLLTSSCVCLSLFSLFAVPASAAQVACYPFEVARTNIAVSCDLRLGVLGCLVGIVREEGFFALYSGLSATLVGVIPFNAIKLNCYDLLRRLSVPAGDNEERTSLPWGVVAAMGATSGVVAATSCFPLEVVRRRQMMGELAGLAPLAAIAQLMRSEGAGVLARGAGVNCVKVAMGNSVGFVLYELMKDVLQVDGRRPPWANKGKRKAQ